MLENREELPAICRMTMDFVRRLTASDEAAELCGRVILAQENSSTCLALAPAEQALFRKFPVLSSFFVLERGFLSTRRNWLYEQTIRARIREMLAHPVSAEVPLPSGFDSLKKCQVEAVKMMSRYHFSLLTGGPGTGKTYTIAHAVKMVHDQCGTLRLGLAAPTGKAAARVLESMRKEAGRLGLDEVLQTSTLHSLLKVDRTFVNFRYNRENPLPLDWVIVDEASMIDLALMAKLLEAIPDSCRLTLVGDDHQLASVEPGRVFGDLCKIPEIPKCELTESSRFPEDGEIARFARAVNNGNADKALALLKTPDSALLHRYQPGEWQKFTDLIRTLYHDFALQTEPEKALAALNRCKVLCACRNGKYGVRRLNAYMRAVLGKSAPLPLMITANNADLDVHNGDIGVVMPGSGDLVLSASDGTLRSIPLALLPQTEYAFASTIHKSQGSEYQNVVIVLPESSEDLPVYSLLTREILYTAITRTSGGIYLFAGDSMIRRCCENRIARVTGLVP